jgi:hypothetical protein
MSAITYTLADAQNALKNNGVSAAELLKHPYKQWDPEATVFLQTAANTPIEKQPESTAAAIARKFIGLGGHVIFFPRGTKACKTPGWEQRATNDLSTALQWVGEVGPDANVGIVGKQDGLWALDDDAGLLDEYIQKYGPIDTYATKTVSGGKHFIFRQNAA